MSMPRQSLSRTVLRSLPRLDWFRGRHALQTAVAAMLTYAAASILKLPEGYWGVMTAILVVQANVGASIGLAIDRFFSTLLGAAVGAALGLGLGGGPLMTGIEVAIAVLVLGYAASARPSLRVAPVTAVIIILTDPSRATPIAAAFDRAFEITVGAVCALVVSLLVFPARARTAFTAQIGVTFTLMARHLGDGIDRVLGQKWDEAAVFALNQKVRAALIKADTMVTDSQRELAGHVSDHPDPMSVMRTLRRLWYAQLMISRSAGPAFPADLIDAAGPALRAFRDAATAALIDLGQASREARSGESLSGLAAAADGVAAAFDRIRDQDLASERDTRTVERLYTVAFAIDQVSRHIAELADRIADLLDLPSRPGGTTLGQGP